MALDAVANFASSTVSTAPSPALTGTTLTLAANTGYLTPVTVPFDAVLTPSGTAPSFTASEIVTVTAQPRAVVSIAGTLPQAIITVVSTTPFAGSGTVTMLTATGPQSITYTGLTATTFTGCSGGTGAFVIGNLMAADSLTLARASQNTLAKSVVTGWVFNAGPTAKTITDLAGNSPALISRLAPSGALTVGTPVTYDDTKAFIYGVIEGTGTALSAALFANNRINIEMLSPGVYLCVYACSNTSANWGARVITLQGRSITLGTELNISALLGNIPANGNTVGIERMSDTTALISWSNSASNTLVMATVANLATATPTVTVGTAVNAWGGTASPNSFDQLCTAVLDANTFAVLWTCVVSTNYVSKITICTVSGNTITSGAPVTIYTASTTYTPLNGLVSLTPNLLVAGINDQGVSYYTKLFSIQVSGTVPKLINSTTTNFTLAQPSGIAKISPTAVALLGPTQSVNTITAATYNMAPDGTFSPAGVPNALATQFGTNASPRSMLVGPGNTIIYLRQKGSFGIIKWLPGVNQWVNGITHYPASTASIDPQPGGIAHIDGYSYLRVQSISGGSPVAVIWDLNPNIGICTTAAAYNTPATIQISGIVTGLSGLVQGLTYYLQGDRTLTTVPSPWRVGVALGTTMLQLIRSENFTENVRSFYAPYNPGNTTGVIRQDVTTAAVSVTSSLLQPLNFNDATAGAVTVNLPRASMAKGAGPQGQDIIQYFTKVDSSANAVVLTPNAAAGDLIANATTYSLTTQGQTVALIPTGFGYWVK